MEKGRSENLLRRLHSLSGVLPIGIFMCVHLGINYTANWGPESYNFAALFMSELLPSRVVLEIGVIFIPILFHAIYGIYIAVKSGYNASSYSYGANWRFVLQRVAGIVCFAFLVWHIYTTKVQVMLGTEADFLFVHNVADDPFEIAFWIIGLLCCVYHFVNGLWTFLISWGLTVSERSQKVAKYVLVVVFIVLAAFAIRAIFAFI
jgi:succinate dehydrogenase / fumarate reductase cytochrome b subunit